MAAFPLPAGHPFASVRPGYAGFESSPAGSIINATASYVGASGDYPANAITLQLFATQGGTWTVGTPAGLSVQTSPAVNQAYTTAAFTGGLKGQTYTFTSISLTPAQGATVGWTGFAPSVTLTVPQNSLSIASGYYVGGNAGGIYLTPILDASLTPLEQGITDYFFVCTTSAAYTPVDSVGTAIIPFPAGATFTPGTTTSLVFTVQPRSNGVLGGQSPPFTIGIIQPAVPSLTGVLSGNNVNLTFSDSTPGCTFDLSYGGALTVLGVTSPYSYTTTSPGVYTFQVRASLCGVATFSVPSTTTIFPAQPSGVTYTISGLSISLGWTGLGTGYTYNVSAVGLVNQSVSIPRAEYTGLKVGTTTFNIQSVYAGIASTTCNVQVSVITATPYNFTANTIGSSIELSWKNDTPGATFTLSSSSPASLTTQTGIVAPNYTYTDVPGGSYSFTVFSTSAGIPSASATVAGIVSLTAPYNFAVTTLGSTANFTWQEASSGASFNISYIIAGSTLSSKAVAAGATSTSIAGLASGNYTFGIQSLVTEASSSFVTASATIVAAPTSFTATSTGTTISLSWIETTPDCSFTVSQATLGQKTTTASNVQYTGTAGSSYLFTLTPSNTSKFVGPSVTTTGIVLSTPNPSAVLSGINVDVSWPAVTGTSVTYTVSSSPGVPTPPTQPGSALSVSFVSPPPGAYTFSVIASDSLGNVSVTGTTSQLTVPVPQPTDLALVMTASSQLTVTWTELLPECTFTYQNGPVDITPTVTNVGTSYTAKFNGVPTGQVYSPFTVTAKNNGINSLASAPVNDFRTFPPFDVTLSATCSQSGTTNNATATYTVNNPVVWINVWGPLGYVANPFTIRFSGTSLSPAVLTESAVYAGDYQLLWWGEVTGVIKMIPTTFTQFVVPPTNIAVTANASTLLVKWTDSTTAGCRYTIVGTPGTFTSNVATGIGSTGVTFTGATIGTAYTFVVTASSSGNYTASRFYNPYGASIVTTEDVAVPYTIASVSLSSTAVTPINYPTTFTATATGPTIAISWSAVTGATGYNVLDGGSSLFTTTTATTCNYAGTAGQTYSLRVQATGSSVSNTNPTSITVVPVSVPTFSYFSQVSGSLEIGTTGTGLSINTPTGLTLASTGANSFTFSGIGGNTAYSFTLTSTATNATSSATSSFTTMGTPAITSATAQGTATITVNWTYAGPTVTAFTVYSNSVSSATVGPTIRTAVLAQSAATNNTDTVYVVASIGGATSIPSASVGVADLVSPPTITSSTANGLGFTVQWTYPTAAKALSNFQVCNSALTTLYSTVTYVANQLNYNALFNVPSISAYSFVVIGKDSVGSTVVSLSSAAVTPVAAPTITSLVQSGATITIAATGSGLSTPTVSPATLSTVSTSSPWAFTGASGNTAYTFTVQANGTGASNTSTSNITTLATPAIPTVSASGTTVTVDMPPYSSLATFSVVVDPPPFALLPPTQYISPTNTVCNVLGGATTSTITVTVIGGGGGGGRAAGGAGAVATYTFTGVTPQTTISYFVGAGGGGSVDGGGFVDGGGGGYNSYVTIGSTTIYAGGGGGGGGSSSFLGQNGGNGVGNNGGSGGAGGGGFTFASPGSAGSISTNPAASVGTRIGTYGNGGGANVAGNSGIVVIQQVIERWPKTSAPNADWESIASSSDGTKLAAGVSNGGVYTNASSGVGAWTQTSLPSAHWISIASSSDGTKLAAAAYNGGGIWTNASSGAGTWTQTSALTSDWASIASSSDGTKLAAAAYGGGIYTNASSGAGAWTQTSAPNAYWQSIASSSDGTKLAAVVSVSGIYTNANSGAGAWTKTSAPALYWSSIASSSDGTKLAASAYFNAGIYTNASSGAGAWTQTSAPNSLWISIASSSDGTKLAAVVDGGGIYTNANSGQGNWTLASAPTLRWTSIASSSDGTKLVAGVYAGGIYTYLSTYRLTVLGTSTTFEGVAGTTYSVTAAATIGANTSITSPSASITPVAAPANTLVTQSGANIVVRCDPSTAIFTVTASTSIAGSYTYPLTSFIGGSVSLSATIIGGGGGGGAGGNGLNVDSYKPGGGGGGSGGTNTVVCNAVTSIAYVVGGAGAGGIESTTPTSGTTGGTSTITLNGASTATATATGGGGGNPSSAAGSGGTPGGFSGGIGGMNAIGGTGAGGGGQGGPKGYNNSQGGGGGGGGGPGGGNGGEGQRIQNNTSAAGNGGDGSQAGAGGGGGGSIYVLGTGGNGGRGADGGVILSITGRQFTPLSIPNPPSGLTLVSSTLSSFVYSGYTAGTTYTFTIQATIPGITNTVTGSVTPLYTPGTPTLASAGQTITIAWTYIGSASGITFNVKDANNNWAGTTVTGSLTTTFTGESGKSYSIYVYATSGANQSPNSVSTSITLVGAPTLTQNYQLTTQTKIVGTAAAAGATSYSGTTDSTSALSVPTVTGSTLTWTGASAGRRYTGVTIGAFNGSSTSSAANQTLQSTFDPKSISGLYLWLDGADPSSIVLSPTSTVTQWKDKSGNNRIATPLDAAITVTNLNQNTAILFGSSRMGIPSFPWYNHFTVFFVVKTGGTFLYADGYYVAYVSTLNWGMSSYANDSVIPVGPNSIIPQNEWCIYSVGYGGGVQMTNYAVNGSLRTSTASAQDAQRILGSEQLTLNGNTSWATGNSSQVAEIIHFNRSVTSEERQNIEGYLAWKWGLQGILSSTNPYSPLASPPATRPPFSFTPKSIDGCVVWLDAADTTTYTSGSSITSWTNKGTAPLTASRTTGTFSSTSINGRPAIALSVQAAMAVTPVPFTTVSRSMFLVVTMGSYVGVDIFFTTGANVSPTFRSLPNGSLALVGPLVNFQTNFPINFFNKTSIVSVASGIYINGASQTLSTNNGNNSFTTGTATTLTLGNQSSSLAGYTLGEMIIFDGLLTDTQRQSVEVYLAEKWGIQTVGSFTPKSIDGLALWLDAADPAGNGTTPSTITVWNDKSGMANNATIASGTATVLTNGINFDGTSTFFSIPGIAGKLANTPFVVFAVETFNGTFANKGFYFADGVGGSAPDSAMAIGYRQSGSPFGGGAYTMAFWNDDINDTNFTTSSPLNVRRLWTNYLPSAANRNIRLNGAIEKTHTNFNRLSSFTTPVVGRGEASGNFYKGVLSEIIVFNTDIGLSSILAVEVYLAQKWGIQLS